MRIALFCFLIGWAVPVLTVAAPVSGPDLMKGGELSVEPGAKGTVLVFLSARCPCSNSHVPVLTQLAAEYREFNFVAVHSNADEPMEEAKKYFSALQLPFPVIRDHELKLANEFRALKTPHAFILSPSGQILYKGGITNSSQAPAADKNFLREALADLTVGKAVRTADGRTLGCEIKRRKVDAW